MDDHLLVKALRDHDAGAPAAMYGAYADRLYAYCWFQLHERDAAQVALRDTFVVAEAHAGKLREPERFGPWLYAIARLECRRRTPARVRPPEPPTASREQGDDQRLMAWRAVLALRSRSRELLDLRYRHRLPVPDVAAVLDLQVKEAQAALDRAQGELEEALTAEILARKGPSGCDERASLLRERARGRTPDIGLRLAGHAQDCEVCEAFLPRKVSAAKVYGLLPEAVPPRELRLRVMSCFLDPEMAGYRLFAATRVTEFAPSGFPVQSQKVPSRPGAGRGWWRRLRGAEDAPEGGGLQAHAIRVTGVLIVVTMLSAAGLAAAYKFLGLGGRKVETTGVFGGPQPSAVPGLSQMPVGKVPPGAVPGTGGASGVVGAVQVTATFPLGASASSAPPLGPLSAAPQGWQASSGAQSAVPENVPGTLVVTPGYLDLAGGSDGVVQLRAEGGVVAWRARPWGAVRLSQSSGRLAPGQTMSVGVHAVRDPHSRGEGGVAFQPGGAQIRVTWRANAPAPAPAPTPTPTPSAAPAATSAPAETPRSGRPWPPVGWPGMGGAGRS